MGRSRNILQSEQEMLEVPLSSEEVRQRGELLAANIGELEELEVKEKAFKEVLKKKRDPLDAEVRVLSHVVRRKAEPRPVLVETVADFERGVAVSIRTDTGEVIRERELTMDERQPTLLPMPRRRRADPDAEVIAP